MYNFAPPRSWTRAAESGMLRFDRQLPDVNDAKAREAINELREQYGRPKVDFSQTAVRAIMAAAIAQESYLSQLRPDQLRDRFGRALEIGAAGQVTSGDFTAFTTQMILFQSDVWAEFAYFDVVSVRQMDGPTARVGIGTTIRGDDCGSFYSANDPVVDGLDPSCTVCPDDCERGYRIAYDVDGVTMEAECRRIEAAVCWPADLYHDSQYGGFEGSLAAVLNNSMREALQRDIQAQGLTNMAAAAGGTTTWAQTVPAAGYFSTANPREWRETLMSTAIESRARAMLNATDGRVQPTHILGGVDSLSPLSRALPFELTAPLTGNQSSVSNYGAFLGQAKGSLYRIYRFVEGMPANTLLAIHKDDNMPSYLYGVFLSMAALDTVDGDNPGDKVYGMAHLADEYPARPGRIQEIQLTA